MHRNTREQAAMSNDATGGLLPPFDPSNILGHVASAIAILGTMVGLLPSLAAGIACLFYAVQVYESKTVQQYMKKRRRKLSLRRRKRRELYKRVRLWTIGR